MKKTLRLLSFITAVIMCLTAGSVAFAAGTNVLYIDFPTSDFTRATYSEYGSVTESSSGQATLYNLSSVNSRNNHIIMNGTKSVSDFLKKYVVFTTDFMTDDTINSFCLSSANSVKKVGNVITSEYFEHKRWNHITMIMEIDTTTTTTLTVKGIETYINGSLVDEFIGNATFNNKSSKPIIGFMVARNTNAGKNTVSDEEYNSTYYLSRIGIYAMDSKPAVQSAPEITIDGTTYSNGDEIYTTADVKLSDISASEDATSLKVYTDDTFITEITNTSAVLQAGNVIVAKEYDKLAVGGSGLAQQTVYYSSYITFIGDRISIHNNATPAVINSPNMTQSEDTVTNLAGNSASVTEFTIASNANGLWGLGSAPERSNGFNYMVAEYTLMKKGGNYIVFTTDNSEGISSALVLDDAEWTKLVYVLNLTDKTSKTYINGVAGDTFTLTGDTAQTLYQTGGTETFRMIFNNKDNTSEGKLYIESADLYFALEEPTVAANTFALNSYDVTTEGKKYILDGNTLYVGNQNIDSSFLLNGAESVKFANANLTASETAANGGYIIFIKNGMYNAYTLSTDNKIVGSAGDSINAAAFANKAAKLYVAQYSGTTLKDVKVIDINGFNSMENVEKNSEASTFKFMVFDGNLVPLCDSVSK